MSNFYSVGEVSALLGLSTKSVYKLIKTGKIRGAFRLGDNSPWLICKETFSAHLTALATKPAPLKLDGGSKSRHNLI